MALTLSHEIQNMKITKSVPKSEIEKACDCCNPRLFVGGESSPPEVVTVDNGYEYVEGYRFPVEKLYSQLDDLPKRFVNVGPVSE